MSNALHAAREVERIGARDTLWPGFDPLSIPLAIYDGERTWLFRHPAPPDDFAPSALSSIRAHVRDGRHPAVTSNSSAEIGGVLTATLLADGERGTRPPAELAATALHEAFHVFQRARHPAWMGNEGDLLLYPVDDANLLALRRLESEALRRALGTRTQTACYAQLALHYRTRRYSLMDSAFRAYERGTELNEGLATYIQLRSLGRSSVTIPPDEFPATAVRQRIYATGPAVAFLLDRIRPGWQQSLEAHDRQALDEVLGGALASRAPVKATGCAFTSGDIARITQRATADAARVRADRSSRREQFDARAGWRVELVITAGQPLWPQGFDPLNLERVDGGVLHTRFLKLGNDRCALTAIDEADADIDALTEGAGAHPLFNGVRRAVVEGLAAPNVAQQGRTVTIETRGLTVRCDAAELAQSRGDETILVRVLAP